MNKYGSRIYPGLGVAGHQFSPVQQVHHPEIPHTEITSEQPDPGDRIAVMWQWLGMFHIFSIYTYTSSS